MSRVSTYGYSDMGGRPINEDSGGIYVYADKIIAVVADGLGGQGDGNIASALALEELADCGIQAELPEPETIHASFLKANEAIMERQQNKFHMKTTAVYLCIYKDHAIWAHIGDSRLYHFYQNEICHVTLDHSVSQLAVFLGEISRSEIPHHSGRSRLIKALGCDEAEPEIHETVLLEPGKHVFLLCTDGFWEYMEEEELAHSIAEVQTAEEWIAFLRGQIAKRCGDDHDNNTAMAVFLEV